MTLPVNGEVQNMDDEKMPFQRYGNEIIESCPFPHHTAGIHASKYMRSSATTNIDILHHHVHKTVGQRFGIHNLS